MITGRLIELNEKYYAVLNLKHPDGSRWQKRIDLELSLKNNKRRAEEKLAELRLIYTRQQSIQNNCPDMLFVDYMHSWLDKKQNQVSPTTFTNYHYVVSRYFERYFSLIPLQEVTSERIQEYYESLKNKRLSTTTIQHHHMLLKQMLTDAYRNRLLSCDPMEGIEKPKRQLSQITVLSASEAQILWSALKGTKLEIVIKLTLYYGLRRSEVLGLKWSDVDFINHTLTIQRAVVNSLCGEKYVIVEKDELKNDSGKRTMPLGQEIRTLLLNEKQSKERFASPFICTDQLGNLIKPDHATHAFSKLLKKIGLRHIRFHDLRHTCASLLIAQRCPLIEVQHWLGHSTMMTTANIYGHLDFSMKLANEKTMSRILTARKEAGYKSVSV